jgi:hypothetical protein
LIGQSDHTIAFSAYGPAPPPQNIAAENRKIENRKMKMNPPNQ